MLFKLVPVQQFYCLIMNVFAPCSNYFTCTTVAAIVYNVVYDSRHQAALSVAQSVI